MRELFSTAILILAMTWHSGAFADGGGPCSTKDMAGGWLFATDVGHIFDFGGDITAIGTMNIDRRGNLAGTFDATVQNVIFLPDITYEGTIVVNSDCTGHLTFVTSLGAIRTDSIAVVSRTEFWGMSQDFNNLWNYSVRRISAHDDDDD